MKRTIIAEGDSASVVTRRAVKYMARAQVRTESGESLILAVAPNGEWTLRQDSGAGTESVLLTCGRLK